MEEIWIKTAAGELKAEVIRSARRTMALQVYGDGRIVVRVPNRIGKREIEHFAASHTDWIAAKRRELSARVREKKRRQSQYEIPEYESLDRAEKARIRQHFMERLQIYAPLMGVTFHRVTIRNQKGRWGSCSGQGNLNFNYRLHYLPQELMDYVVVHELAHRVYMNHSKEFWKLVEKYNPDYITNKKKLKEIGIES